jgi:hypothetical protein
VATERWSGPVPTGADHCRRGRPVVLPRVQEGLTRLLRLLVSRVAVLTPSGGGTVLWVREAQGGSRTRGVDGEDPKGEETHKSIGRQVGATRVGRERIRKGREASKSVKLAEWIDSAARVQDD